MVPCCSVLYGVHCTTKDKNSPRFTQYSFRSMMMLQRFKCYGPRLVTGMIPGTIFHHADTGAAWLQYSKPRSSLRPLSRKTTDMAPASVWYGTPSVPEQRYGTIPYYYHTGSVPLCAYEVPLRSWSCGVTLDEWVHWRYLCFSEDARGQHAAQPGPASAPYSDPGHPRAMSRQSWTTSRRFNFKKCAPNHHYSLLPTYILCNYLCLVTT